MKRTSLWMLVVLLAMGLGVTGCNLLTGSDETADNDTLPESPDELDLEFGGYDATPEDPGFGDTTILTEFGEATEEYIDDPSAGDPQVRDMENAPSSDIYILRITWGHLEEEGDSDVDWSGTAAVVRGALIGSKAILFEVGDYIHRPRPDRLTLEWTSHTYTHYDGLALMIIDPETDPATEVAENEFAFETGPFTQTFTMEELADIDTVFTVDGEGNAVHFLGRKREPHPCMAGFLRGQWFRRGQDWGQFRGGWITEDGETVGHLQGMWGYDADGRNVLVGKYIDDQGNFKGLLKGTFGADPTGSPHGAMGWFRGQWYDENEEPRGQFRGKWKAPNRRDRGGYFRGMWGQNCPELEANTDG